MLYWYRHHHNLVPLEKSLPLHYGEVLHACIAHLYQHNWNIWGVIEIAAEMFDESIADKDRNAETLTNVINSYHKQYEGWEKHEKLISVEQTYDVQMSDNLWYRAKIDRITAIDNILIIYDIKHSTRTPNDWQLSQWLLEPQFMGYIWTAQNHIDFKNYKDILFIIDHITVTKKKVELNRYGQKYEAWKIDEWHWSVVDYSDGMMALYPEYYRLPMSCDCTRYFRECDYFPLCSSPPESRENLMHHLYKKEVWIEQKNE